MKAIVFDHYGPPEELTLQEVPAPAPTRREVLVEVRAAALNAADWHVLRADPFLARLKCRLFRPRVKRLGADVAGAGKQMAAAIFMGPWLSEKSGRRLAWVDMKPTQADLQVLADLLGTGKLTPVIDRRYALAQVPEAIKYLEEGHARGKVVITV
jgi:NADPH:quinone reductase-like Zn-dependent oxidoreductase